MYEAQLGAFSRGLTRTRPGDWKCAVPAVAANRAKHIIDSLGELSGEPPSVILVTAALLLLGRYHGADCVGIALNTDDNATLDQQRFIRVEISPSDSFRDVAANVRSEMERARDEAQSHEADVADVLPCVVILRNDQTSGIDAVRSATGSMLAINCLFGPDECQIKIYHRQHAHADWLAEQFGRHLARVLELCLANPEMAVGRMGLLDRSETSSILKHSRGANRRYPLDRPLAQLLKDQVERTPDRTALVSENEDGSKLQLSYRELDHRVDGLASRLLSQGARPGAPVGIYMERSIDLIIALLAVLRAGCIYVPLDRSYPAEYLRFILEDTRAALLIADTTVSDGIVPSNIPIIGVNEKNGHPTLTQFPDAPTGHPCLIMYTSGSTGRPKGVVHCQRQVINRLHWMWETYPFSDDDVIAQRSPVTVMPSAWELLGGLLAGVITAVVPDAAIRAPNEFAAFLSRHRVSFMTLTPTLLRLLLDSRSSSAAWPSALRLIIIGGEPLTDNLYREFRSVFPDTTMVNDFGATEVNTVLHVALPPSQADGIDVGYRPIANVSTFILDDFMRAVPFGAQGELCVAGESVALNYLNLADATAERFVHAQPGGPEPALRIYRTGDMGYMTPDGAIHITGRRDHQVKIRGRRVELGEVERVLRLHPAVAQCVVVDHADPVGGPYLTAYVLPRGSQLHDSSSLRTHAREHLPQFMVPRHFEWVTALPRRPNGKLDRLALRRSAPAAPATASEFVAFDPVRIATIAARVLGLKSDLFDPNVEFDALGFDSVTLVELAKQLSDELQWPVSVPMLFNCPTVIRLTEHLQQSALDVARDKTRQTSAKTAIDSSLAVAIIGMSGRFPGADDIDQFWKNLRAGVESIGTVAPGRWDAETIYDPNPASERRSYSKWGGFLSDADRFEPQFFGLSPSDASAMDPQQRLCLMESWRALEDAGYTGHSLSAQNVGVFVGAREPDYPVVLANAGNTPNAQTLLGSDMSLLAARISYFCDLHGPSMVVDTACSSALVSVHLACRSLRDDECTMALAGAVCVTNDPDFYVATSKLNIFSPTGHCRAFDEKADGFVHGEGVGFVVLKRLDRAVADRDHIYAVIRGTAVNQDGRSNGITAPNGNAQIELQTSLYRKFDINPDTIGYVEAHGTGTPLGDPIEVQALACSFGRFTNRKQYCALGSVKTNIGHLTAAAGIAGLIKSVLCLHHRELVPSLHFERPNPMIDFANTPFYVNTICRSWESDPNKVRRAAINAFGIGGTNAHVVLEESAQRDHESPHHELAYVIPVTAANPDVLAETIRLIRLWIDINGNRHALRDISFSLLVGRRIFNHGYVLITRGMSELAAQLAEIDAGRLPTTARRMSFGRAEMHRAGEAELGEIIKSAWTELVPSERIKCLLDAANLMAQGRRTDWSPFFARDQARRVRLPTTTFATRRYWVNAHPGRPSEQSANGHHVRNQLERQLPQTITNAVSETLGVSPVSPDQPLSLYGLDSLRAISLQHALEQDLGARLPLEQLLGGASINDIIEHLADFKSAVATGDKPNESRDNELVERFLNGEIDLDTMPDEKLDWLQGQLHERINAAYGN